MLLEVEAPVKIAMTGKSDSARVAAATAILDRALVQVNRSSQGRQGFRRSTSD
jgi:hypothetical protein